MRASSMRRFYMENPCRDVKTARTCTRPKTPELVPPSIDTSLLKGFLAAYNVVIDGVKVGRAKRGRTIDFSVSSGSHVVQIRAGIGTKSNELSLDITAGQRRSLTSWGTRPFA